MRLYHGLLAFNKIIESNVLTASAFGARCSKSGWEFNSWSIVVYMVTIHPLMECNASTTSTCHHTRFAKIHFSSLEDFPRYLHSSSIVLCLVFLEQPTRRLPWIANSTFTWHSQKWNCHSSLMCDLCVVDCGMVCPNFDPSDQKSSLLIW